MTVLGVADRYIDAFCGRVPRSIFGRHYTDYCQERLRLFKKVESLIRAGMVGIMPLKAKSAAELVNLLAKRERVFLRAPTIQLELL